MRRLLPAALIFLAIGPVPGTQMRFPVADESQQARAIPIAFAPQASGMLRFVRGWHLVSPNSHFGGFSAIARIGAGRFRLVGDNGYVADLSFGARGGIRSVRIHPLPAPDGRRDRKSLVDTEALYLDPATGKMRVGLEVRNEVWRFDAGLSRIEARGRLPRWPRTSGPEAMAHLADGRTVIFAEHMADDPRGSAALLFAGDPAEAQAKPLHFLYDSQGKGRVSDAAPLPDGRILLVHRKLGFDPFFTTILAIVDPADIRKDAVVRSVPIGRVPKPLADNFEGAAVALENGRTRLWLVSDNNFNSWQRSLLLEFDLVGLPPRKADGKKAAR